MITSRIIICAFLCASLAQAQLFFYWSDADYYTTTVTTTYEIYPQDDKDAQAIVDDNLSEKVFASILPYREKIRCMTIIREIGKKHGGVDYIADTYVPQQAGSSIFQDFVYVLTKDENAVLGGYLEVFFEREDLTWITIPMVLTKTMCQMVDTYDKYHAPKTFKDLRKRQKSPYENMLRVWVRGSREPNEKGNLDENQVKQDADALVSEHNNGCWKEDREQIEKTLFQKSIRYAQAVINKCESALQNSIEKIIQDCQELDRDLANAYSSMAVYIKDKHQYIANVMSQYSDGADKWAAWFMCIAVTTPKEWSKVDTAFQKNHPGDSLSKFITQKMTNDKILAEMIAAVVDPKFKPTTFSASPSTDGLGPTSTLPPATPTTPAPSSSHN